MSNLTIALIPGGPGLTTDTMTDLFRLENLGSVVPLDPPESSDDWSYNALLSAAQASLDSIIGSVVVVGHSFGGILSTELALTNPGKIVGLVCLATPFRKSTFDRIGSEYTAKKTEALGAAELAFEKSPSNETFLRWLASYGELYFQSMSVARGAKMLLDSKAEVRAFMGARGEAAMKEELLERIQQTQLPRIYLAGDRDGLLPIEVATEEAKLGDFRFHAIPRAGHFHYFDNPDESVRVIEEFIRELKTNKGEK